MSVSPSTRAKNAEARGDWSHAKMWWFYAAAEMTGNPHGLRTYYCQREDLAGERMRSTLQ